MIINVDGGTVFCEVTGSGPPLMIPGNASTPRFMQVAKLFSDDFTVIGHDVRGEGLQTDFADLSFTVSDLADHCASVLSELGYEKAHYLGLSHTGMVGLAFAIEHPNRVDRLVLSNTTPGFVPEEAGGDYALPVTGRTFNDAMAAAEEGLPGAVRRVSEHLYSEAAVEQAPSIVDDTVECYFGPVFAQSPEARAASWVAYGEFNVRDRLSEIQSPTLVMTSSSDRIGLPANAWMMWNEIPRSIFIATDGIGHDWMAEAPVLGSRLVTMFIKGEMDPTYR